MLHGETTAYKNAYRRPAVYFYLTDLSMMCKTHLHYVLKYGYDILINNINTKQIGLLKKRDA